MVSLAASFTSRRVDMLHFIRVPQLELGVTGGQRFLVFFRIGFGIKTNGLAAFHAVLANHNTFWDGVNSPAILKRISCGSIFHSRK